ncbi:MAG: extracellular solute-binding protein [Oscillospiraceae bacterium]|nr:extracellular solute-binding protein [Oscillospiraceae bacterium]
MKSKIKKIIPLMVVLALVVCSALTACKQKEDDVLNNTHEGVKRRAKELKDHNALPDVEVTEQLKILSWYSLDEGSPTAELYKARYWPSEETTVDEQGNEVAVDRQIFTVLNTSYENRYSRLSTLVMSGESPDFFLFEERGFPYGVHADQFSPIDDLIDLSGEEWNPTRDVIDLFKWGGKNYTAVTELNNSSALLYYRKSVIEEAGFDNDPYDLWEQNNWTWDTFRSMCQEFSEPGKKWGIVGYYIDEAAILSTGTGLISIEDGLLKSNMDDSRIERAMEFLQELAKKEFRFPYHEISNFQIGPAQFRSGEVLFWNDGPWRYQETLAPISEREQWDDDEIGIVPFPRDPQSSEFFHRGKQDALMLVAGSKNRDGFKAWTQCSIVANFDEEMKKHGRDKAKQDYKWTDTHLDILEKIRTLTPVWDFKNGIGADVSDPVLDSPVEKLSKPVIVLGESYTQMRGENKGIIEARLKEMNAKVKQG